jgi:hypothetical protein
MTSMGPANTKQPTECYPYRDVIPTIPGVPKFYAEVPQYQTLNLVDDMVDLLQECCHSEVWIYSNPEPCTVVCNSSSEKQAIDVSYCLNSKTVIYGGVVKDSGVGSLVSGSMNAWTVLLVSLVVLSMMI